MGMGLSHMGRSNMSRLKTGNPPCRPHGSYGPDVMAVVKMEPDRIIRFRYATERETQSKYRCMRRAVEKTGHDRIVHKKRQKVEVE